jgi:Uma2 family endonuclease
MTAIQSPLVSFEEYLAFQAEQDLTYELENGVLIPMPVGRSQHTDIAKFLEKVFDSEIERLGLPLVTYRGGVGIRIPQVGRRSTVRIPDLMVVTGQQREYLATLTDAILEESMPPLVVEVVSAGTVAIDHRKKRAEYNSVEIPEYWIVDFITDAGFPEAPKVTVCTLVEGLYEAQIFRGGDRIQSPQFPALEITAEQVVQAGSSVSG